MSGSGLVCNVVGARPNFMKMAPLVAEMKRRGIPQKLIHTGQHYDRAMAEVFFEELNMPEPDVCLGVGSGSHAQQTAKVMVQIEEFCLSEKPRLMVVAGDVNSTVAASLAAAKVGVPVAHLEAGLRSFDRTMPEELNRVVTDHLSDLLFTTEESANKNLAMEGIPDDRVRFVGNCMVDSLRKYEKRAVRQSPWELFDVEPGKYVLLTLHRPSNVDDDYRLHELAGLACRVSERVPVLFPAHPRTKARLESNGFRFPNAVHLLEPLPYVMFLGLMARASAVLTDSGGIQEETTALGVPCLTLRSNTERPSTILLGTNELIGEDIAAAESHLDRILRGEWKKGTLPPLWDGHAAGRAVEELIVWLGQTRQLLTMTA